MLTFQQRAVLMGRLRHLQPVAHCLIVTGAIRPLRQLQGVSAAAYSVTVTFVMAVSLLHRLRLQAAPEVMDYYSAFTFLEAVQSMWDNPLMFMLRATKMA